MTTHPDHVHPRHKRKIAPNPYKPLFRDVKPGQSKARPAHTYRAARRNGDNMVHGLKWIARHERQGH